MKSETSSALNWHVKDIKNFDMSVKTGRKEQNLEIYQIRNEMIMKYVFYFMQIPSCRVYELT